MSLNVLSLLDVLPTQLKSLLVISVSEGNVFAAGKKDNVKMYVIHDY